MLSTLAAVSSLAGWACAVLMTLRARRLLRKKIDDVIDPALKRAIGDITNMLEHHSVDIVETYVAFAHKQALTSLTLGDTAEAKSWSDRARGASEVGTALHQFKADGKTQAPTSAPSMGP